MENDGNISAGKPEIGVPVMGIVGTPKPDDKPVEKTTEQKDEQANDAPKQD